MNPIYHLEDGEGLTGQLKHYAYNASDATATHEVATALLSSLKARPRAALTYASELAYQSVSFTTTLRGVRVDLNARKEVLRELTQEVEGAANEVAALSIIAEVWDAVEKDTGTCPRASRKDGKHKWSKPELGCGQVGHGEARSGTVRLSEEMEKERGRVCLDCGAARLRPLPFNANSSAQARHLFADLLAVKRSDMNNRKGEFSADDEVLGRIGKKYPKLTLLVESIQKVRDLRKQIGALNARLDNLGRFRSSTSIGATWTGRTSASKDPFGQGANIQTIGEQHRRMFIADPGWELFYADFCRAESMVVAFLAEDEAYIKAHETDLHSYVARLLWPDIEWTWDIEEDAKIAKSILPEWDNAPGHDLRFQAKRVAHGSSYGLSPHGIAIIAHIPRKVAEEAQARFFSAFPGIKNTFQARVVERVSAGLPLLLPTGEEIQLMGRPWDKATHRQGFSAVPQGTVARLTLLAMHQVWKEHDFPGAPLEVQLLANVHDAMLGQWKVGQREAALEAVVDAMTIPMVIGDRTCTIPVEVAAGGNWGKAGPLNPNGLKGVYP